MTSSISEITKLWDRILDSTKGRINDARIYDTFLSGSYIHSIEGDMMVVVVNSGLAANLLSTKYLDMLTGVVRECTETDFKLRFVQINEVQAVVKQAPSKPTFFASSYINSKLTFDNFVVGSSNREAYQAALMIASTPGKLYNPLFVYSQSGLGKTHLLHAIGNYIKENAPVSKVLYLSTEDFFEEFIKYVTGDKEGENLKDYFKGIDVLLIDDIQFLANKSKTEEMFFYIFSSMVNAGKQIVLTSDKHPSELQGVEARLVSRFNAGLTVNIAAPDVETCIDILKLKISANGLDIANFDEDVLTFFAEKFSKNVRELEGAFNRLLFYTINIKPTAHIDMGIAIESVQSLIDVKDTKTKLSETKIINIVADYYNLTPSQLTGKIRTSQIAMARHIAMYLVRSLLDVPLTKIGLAFGGKDHTTVMNAVEKVDKALKNDIGLQTAVEDLKKRLKK
ncbi:MAG: chromosomal replication initiator protein DnaA [Erysipelotrichia bacterium]|jgi:chromosomal replication initiator protein|nr:chromosomal replication initiator protein DnaA [Erysipelotrichia bacterium]